MKVSSGLTSKLSEYLELRVDILRSSEIEGNLSKEWEIEGQVKE